MKKFLKSLQLRQSDLFLLIGFIPFAILLIFGQLFMQNQDPAAVALPLWAAIICFVVLLMSWGYYLYLEVWKKRKEFNKFNSIVVCVLLSLILLNIIAIMVQPRSQIQNVFIRYSEEYPWLIGVQSPVLINISLTHKFVFIFELIAAALCIYIGLFVFPKRFKSISFIKYLGYIFFAFAFVLILYGYIAEFDKYISFFKYLLGIEKPDGKTIYDFAVQSFILHRNAYGMMMMVGIIFCFICHSFTKKWYLYLLVVFFYLNMIFSLCKTGLLISAVIIIIYVIYRLIITYKNHKFRNKIAFICIISIILIFGLLFGVAFISKGKIFSKLYNLIHSITGGGQTLNTRSYIWDNCFQLMQNGWWLIGRGFGTFNTMLMPMNIVTHNDSVFPSHSSYIGLLAEGGILFLIAYLLLLAYVGYVMYKSFKKDPDITLTVSLGIISFVAYSFIETIHYLVYVLIFPLMVIYYSKDNMREKTIN